MNYTYLGLNFIGFLLSIASLSHWNMGFLDSSTTSTTSSSTWNYLDTAGGVVGGIRQLHQGEITLGTFNILSSLQLAGCTIIANLAKYSSLIHLSHAAISGLMGFSFAACMFISCGIELCEVIKSDERIEQLEIKRSKIEDKNSEEYKLIQKTILIEHAQRENHINNAASWALCGIAMSIVAIAAYCALSGLSFGIVPGATVIIAGAAFLTGLIRVWLTQQKDHVNDLKKNLKKNEELLQKINNLAIHHFGLNFDEPVVIKKAGFFNETITFRQYLEKMIIYDIKKLNEILIAISDNDEEAFVKALKKHQHKILGELDETTGFKIYFKLKDKENRPPPSTKFNH